MDYKLFFVLFTFGIHSTQVNCQINNKCYSTEKNIEVYWKEIICKNGTIDDLRLLLKTIPLSIDYSKHRIVSITFQESHFSNLTASSEEAVQDLRPFGHTFEYHYENNDIDNVYINVTQGLKKNRIKNLKHVGAIQNLNKVINLSNNVIQKIFRGTFSDLLINRIDVSECEVATIESKSFTKIYEIRSIDLSRNKLRQIVSNTFDQIKLRMFQSNDNFLDLSYNQIELIEPNSFNNLSNLDALNLSNNNLTVLNMNWFNNIPSIKYLNLENNRISDIISESPNTNGSIVTIWSLNLAFNQIEFMQMAYFTKLKDLHGLNLIANPIKAIEPYAFQSLVSIWKPDRDGQPYWGLKLGKLHLTSINSNTFTGLKTIESFNLSEWNIESIEPFAFSDCKALKQLILSHNRLTSIKPNTFANLERLKILDLSYNQLTRIEKNYFEGLRYDDRYSKLLIFLSSLLLDQSKTTLNLGHNQIESIEANAFQSIGGVEVINLSGNYLKNLSIGTFKGLQNLTNLDLSSNKLYQLNKEVLYPLVRLANLNLAHNNLVMLEIKDILLHFQQNIFQTININDNMWDCHNLSEIIRELSENKVDFTSSSPEHFHTENRHGIACYLPEGKELLSDSVLELEFIENFKMIAASARIQTILLIFIFLLVLIFCILSNYTRCQKFLGTKHMPLQNLNSQSTMELINVTN